MNWQRRTIASLALLLCCVVPFDLAAQTPAPNTITTLSQPPPPPPNIYATKSVGRPHICGTAYYPPAARRSHIQGRVEVAFTITAQGTVGDIKVSKSSGSDLLDEATVKCAATWLYKPARQDGVPIAVPWHAMVAWSLGGLLPTTTGLDLCSRILAGAQSMGVVPFYGRITDAKAQKIGDGDRFTCSAATPSTKYALTADRTCPDIQSPSCISLVSVVSDDGTVLFQKPD